MEEWKTAAFQVAVSNEQDFVAVRDDWLARIVETVLRGEGVTSAELSIALVNDAAIHVVNRQFLAHDEATDVISFLLNEADVDDAGKSAQRSPQPRHIDGEVVVSGETAQRCAVEAGCRASDELALYLVHGLLHLCGYDDHSTADRRVMRGRERSHLQKLGLTPHYDD